MKIRFVGMLCPSCGQVCTIWWRNRCDPAWIGYYHWLACYKCHDEPNNSWLMLFNPDRKFIGIVPNGGISELTGILREAGTVQPEEIPF